MGTIVVEIKDGMLQKVYSDVAITVLEIDYDVEGVPHEACDKMDGVLCKVDRYPAPVDGGVVSAALEQIDF